MTVAQLVERLIVAQNVSGSSPLSHPIDRHSKFTFYKNAYFGFKNCYCNFCLVEVVIFGGIEMEIMNLENRIRQLTNRDPVGNMRIVNKLKRRLRKLTNNA